MNEHQSVEEQQIRDLVAGAGPRLVPPTEEISTIKEAARREWREMVVRERQRRRGLRLRGGLAVAAGVALALAVGWWWSTRIAPVAAPVVASVELLAGSARVADAELVAGSQIEAGATVETAGWVEGAPAGVALRLTGGQSLRLAANTGVRLVSAREFELLQGTLYIDSDFNAAGGGVEVVTALGSVRDIGTQFEVRLGEGAAALRVRVREGQIALEAEGERHLADRGDQLSLLSDGSVARAHVQTYGPEWDWVLATAPSIEFEGLSVAAVVSWFGREMGREIRYADARIEALAEGAILSGSSADLTPEETLLNALKSSALRHEVEDGTILITR